MKRSVKIMLGIILALVLTGAAIFLIQGDYVQGLMRPAYDTSKCYDSDGGKNYETQGTTYGKMSVRNSKTQFTDSCNGDALTEYYCENNQIKSRNKKASDKEDCSSGKITTWTDPCYNSECENVNPTYLIVTRPLFIDALKDFINWKEDNGFNIGVLTVDWIVSKYENGNIAEKIKEAIYDDYGDGAKEIKYVLLVGDTQISDPQDYEYGWYDPTETYSLDEEWNVPSGVFLSGQIKPSEQWMQFSDLYYADQDALPQNSEGHPLIISPNYYFDFEKVVGRFPVREPQEIDTIVNKTKATKPVSSVISIEGKDFWAEGLECESWPPPETSDVYEELNYSACYTTLPFSTEKALEGTNISYNNYNLDLSKPAGVPQADTDSEDLKLARELIFNSQSIISGAFHGSHVSNDVFNDYEVQNFKYIFPVYAVNSCLVNTFYYGETDSLGETLIKSDKGPTIVMNVVNEYYFYKLLTEGYSVGEAQMPPFKSYKGSWSMQSLLGDPSLKVLKTN